MILRIIIFEDFLQEILIELVKTAGVTPRSSALMWRIASNTAINLLRRARYRAHPSLNRPLRSADAGDGLEWGDTLEGSAGIEEEVLQRMEIQERIPCETQDAGWKRVRGYALTDAERKRLQRFRERVSRS